jgi:Fe-Mn family superoxide dismutase
LEKVDLPYLDIESILKNLEELPSEIRIVVKNNGGGYYNHMLFWKMLSPAKNNVPSKKFIAQLEEAFGGYEQFKENFEDAGKKHFGSGWVWLIKKNENKLQIITTANQDTPLAIGKPLLCVDLWEHAYYLKYQNRRADYLTNIWNIINWQFVEKQFAE